MVYKNKFYIGFALCLTLKIAANYIFSYFIQKQNLIISSESPFDSNDLRFSFLLIVIIGPLIETFIFQFLPYVILKHFRIKNLFLRLVLPALFFGLSHYYSLYYIFIAIFMGLILNYFYLFSIASRHNPIVWVFILHSVYNLIGFLTSI